MDNRATSHRRHLVTRSALTQIITLLVLLSHAAMALKAAEAATGARFTVMAVVSGSMEPTFKRGDLLLFVKSDESPIRVGDVVLYRKPVPDDDDGPPDVVHRVVEVRERRDGGGADILTKGDDNSVDDAAFLYGGAPYLRRDQVIGKAVGYLPGAGWPAIVFEEAGVDRRAVAGVVGLVALVQIVREAMNA